MANSSKPRLVLFDGVCNVCDAAVLFIIDRDPREEFVFAPLASDLGQRTLREHGIDPSATDSLVLIEDGRAYTCSSASLRIARRLRAPWPLTQVLFLVPRVVRDALYRWFAAHRYTWFGRREECRVPTPELRRRFVTELSPAVRT